MLVKLAFVMQRLKKYLKNFCHDQQRWGDAAVMGGHSCYGGDTAVMRGDIELMGGSPSPPHLGKPWISDFWSLHGFNMIYLNLISPYY